METVILNGDDPCLFQWVGTLIMSKDVLRYNNNYPFKTSEKYVWHIACDEERVRGFFPVEIRKTRLIINNYYVEDDSSEVFALLTRSVIEAAAGLPVECVAQTRHVGIFKKQADFEDLIVWTKYVKMIYANDGHGKEAQRL